MAIGEGREGRGTLAVSRGRRTPGEWPTIAAMSPLRYGLCVLLSALPLPAAAPPASSAAAAAAVAPPPRIGLDVSHHSGVIDWAAVPVAEVAFVYAKATEGVDAADPQFQAIWTKLGELGIPRGAYHFYVTEDDPEAQARFFLDTARPTAGDLRPVVDIELVGHGTPPGLADRLRRFLELVEGEIGVAPVIYTSFKFWNAHLGPGFERYPLWVAEYGVDQPTLPDAWTGWHLWQYEGDAAVSGIEKGADRSRLHHEVELADLLIPSAPPAGR